MISNIITINFLKVRMKLPDGSIHVGSLEQLELYPFSIAKVIEFDFIILN